MTDIKIIVSTLKLWRPDIVLGSVAYDDADAIDLKTFFGPETVIDHHKKAIGPSAGSATNGRKHHYNYNPEGESDIITVTGLRITSPSVLEALSKLVSIAGRGESKLLKLKYGRKQVGGSETLTIMYNYDDTSGVDPTYFECHLIDFKDQMGTEEGIPQVNLIFIGTEVD